MLVLASLLICPFALAQSGLINRVGSVFDDVARGLDLVGEKAQDLIGPGLGFGSGNTGGFVESREYAERFPVGAAPLVSMANEFGEIRVGVWDSQVVGVTAKIAVRAETANLAGEIARTIDIHVTPADNRIEVRTILPDTRADMGKPSIEVNYDVMIPRDASLVSRNDFGDTTVSGIGGSLAIDARFGAVDLHDIGGPVTVRARGEFAVIVQGLRQGGTFELYGARANFRNIAGALKVSNFRGAMELREVAPEADIEVMSESGPITYYVPENETPEVSATVLFGDLQSDVPLARVAQSDFTVARSINANTQQRVNLRASFGNIVIQREGAPPLSQQTNLPANQPFQDVQTQTEPVLENGQLAVEAIPGDVVIKGTDTDQMRLKATKFVRVQSQSNARAALQALDVRVTATESVLKIATSVTDNMAALGCTSYRVDLAIECPRTVVVDVQAQDGHTSISDMGGNASVRQAAGSIAVEHCKGEAKLTNQKGDVQVTSCAGSVEVTSYYGTINLKDVSGKMTSTTMQGKTVIESPHSEIVARATGGDIRIISFEGVNGNYDVRAEQGNISILLPPESDASLAATAENGAVHSTIPLTGNIKKDFQEFVKTTAGTYRVTLQTKNGDILIN